MPLPPYIASKRDQDERDRADYQTVYAREPGAVAAPTAGLHFDEQMLETLRAQGVNRFVGVAEIIFPREVAGLACNAFVDRSAFFRNGPPAATRRRAGWIRRC